jgi:hypothetical protein
MKGVIASYGSRCDNNEYVFSSNYYNFLKITFRC